MTSARTSIPGLDAALPRDLPTTLSLGLPLFVFVAPPILTAIFPDPAIIERWIYGETGLVENLTVLFALIGVVVSLVAARRSARAKMHLLTLWLCFFALGFFYIATEEASWGQHWIPWETPAWLAEINRYGEANLHNVSRTADRIPKTIVGACIILGGVGWPLVRRWRHVAWRHAKDWRRWLLPGDGPFVMAALFAGAWVYNRSLVLLDMESSVGDGFAYQEHRELLMTTFLLLYALSIARRLRAERDALAASPAGDAKGTVGESD